MRDGSWIKLGKLRLLQSRLLSYEAAVWTCWIDSSTCVHLSRRMVFLSEARLTKELGRGTFGVCYEVSLFCQDFAVKVVPFETARDVEDIAREIELLRLLDHPLHVRCHGVDVRNHSVWILMDLVRGLTLEEVRLQRVDPRLTRFELIPIFAEVVCALQYLESLDVIHNDVKPANIGLTIQGHVKLIDFGSASFLSDTSPAMRGSLGYMAPEVLSRQGCSAASNVWSLGCTVFQLLTGQVPFDSCEEVKSGKVNVLDHVGDLLLADLVAAMLVKEGPLRVSLKDLKGHGVFEGVDWKAADAAELEPVLIPEVVQRLKEPLVFVEDESSGVETTLHVFVDESIIQMS